MSWSLEYDMESGAVWIEDETGQTIGICDFYHYGVGHKIIHKPDFAKNALLVRAAPELRDGATDLIEAITSLPIPLNMPMMLWTDMIEKARALQDVLQTITPPECVEDDHLVINNQCVRCGHVC